MCALAGRHQLAPPLCVCEIGHTLYEMYITRMGVHCVHRRVVVQHAPLLYSRYNGIPARRNCMLDITFRISHPMKRLRLSIRKHSLHAIRSDCLNRGTEIKKTFTNLKSFATHIASVHLRSIPRPLLSICVSRANNRARYIIRRPTCIPPRRGGGV